jgi:hypothetical protein
MPGSRVLRVGEDRAQGGHAGARIDADFRERQPALDLIGLAVFKRQFNGDTPLARRQVLVGERAAQAQQGIARLLDIDEDRVELGHRRERSGLIGGHQRALGGQRAADTARDRGIDARTLKIDPGRLDIGLGLTPGRDGIVALLLADNAIRDERLIAAGQTPVDAAVATARS